MRRSIKRRYTQPSSCIRGASSYECAASSGIVLCQSGFPAGRKACMDVGRGEKHLPCGQTGCQSSPKKCRVRTVCCSEQPHLHGVSWHVVEAPCALCVTQGRKNWGEISVVQNTDRAPQPRQKGQKSGNPAENSALHLEGITHSPSNTYPPFCLLSFGKCIQNYLFN